MPSDSKLTSPPHRGPKEVYEAASRLDPFQVLTAEHALLRLELSRAIDAAKIDSGGAQTRRAVALLLDGFRLHQKREDLVVYPVCERLFGGKDGPTSALQEEHEELREAFDRLNAGTDGPGPVSSAGLEEIRRRMETHFVKEERVLFPLMTAHLGGRETADLARRLRTSGLS